MPAKLLTDLVGAPAGRRAGRPRAPGRRHAPDPGGPVRDPRQGHRCRGVPGHPDRRRAADDPDLPEGAPRRPSNETTFAAASDEARPILTGVLCRFEGDQLTLAAADNYRIAVKTIPTLDPVEETSVVIPARSLNELSRVLADIDDPVDVVLARASNQVLFHLEGIDLVSRLIDGQFPNYQQVLPKGHTTRAVLDREELLKAVRLAALIASAAANIVKLQVGVDGEPGSS